MADNGTSCPDNWILHEEPVRSCGRKTKDFLTCDSVLIPVTMNYSIVCGRIYAYQKGLSSAFYYSTYLSPVELGVNASIDISYVSGLSLTHGLVEQRKHVWTFAVHMLNDLQCFLNVINIMENLSFIITLSYLPATVPVFPLHAPGVIKFPLMLVTVTSVRVVI